MRFDFGISFSHPGIKSFARLMFPRFFGMGVAQINFFVDTFFATAPRMPRGSLAALYVSDRVMELVLGGYAIAVATAILPMMSHQAAANDYEGLKRTLTFAVRIVAYITIPAALGLMILREPIIRMLFQHGQFVAESTRLTARPAALLRRRPPRSRLRQAHRPRLLFRAATPKLPSSSALISFVLNIALNIIFLALPFPPLSKRRPGARHCSRHLLRLLHSLFHLPHSLRHSRQSSRFFVPSAKSLFVLRLWVWAA